MPSEQAHIATLNDLDSSRLGLAKNISDAETMLGDKEGALAALKEEARQLEAYDPAAEHLKELNGSAYVSGSLHCAASTPLQVVLLSFPLI